MRSTSEPLHFGVTVVTAPGAVTIAVNGELDIASVRAFETALADVNVEALRHLVLDLDQLDFIDGAGLHAILALHGACLRASTTLMIMPGPRHVQRVFELTGTDQQLPFRRP
jgi:anti-sigma B factor antagonist